MIDWIKKNKKGVIRGMFLVPIILVMVISISHVISWYGLANPMSWAIYLSIAIEIAAMSAISAASVRVKGFAVWFVFVIVTFIQFVGNIYFCFSDIDVLSKGFKDWATLTSPFFEMIGSDIKDAISQRRWLALLEGGLLPLISLASLHFFIKYGGMDDEKQVEIPKQTEDKPIIEPIIEEKTEEILPIQEPVVEEKPEEILPIQEPVVEENVQEPNTTEQIVQEVPQPIITKNPFFRGIRRTGLRT